MEIIYLPVNIGEDLCYRSLEILNQIPVIWSLVFYFIIVCALYCIMCAKEQKNVCLYLCDTAECTFLYNILLGIDFEARVKGYH